MNISQEDSVIKIPFMQDWSASVKIKVEVKWGSTEGSPPMQVCMDSMSRTWI